MRIRVQPTRIPAEELIESLSDRPAVRSAAEVPFAECGGAISEAVQQPGKVVSPCRSPFTSKVGSEGSAPWTPVRFAYLPVRIAAREAEQIGAFEYHWVNRTPEAASRSRFGVRTSAFP